MTLLKSFNAARIKSEIKYNQRPDLVYAFLVIALAISGSLAIFSAGYAYADFRYGDA